jgi:hypothetical protein
VDDDDDRVTREVDRPGLRCAGRRRSFCRFAEASGHKKIAPEERIVISTPDPASSISTVTTRKKDSS